MKTKVIFKSTKVRLVKPMTWFNWISRKLIGVEFDHVEFLFPNGMCIGADGGKKYKSVREIELDKFKEINPKSLLVLVEVPGVLYSDAQKFVGVPYDFKRTVWKHLYRKATGRWSITGKEKEQFACDEFVAFMLNFTNWREIDIRMLWETYKRNKVFIVHT